MAAVSGLAGGLGGLLGSLAAAAPHAAIAAMLEAADTQGLVAELQKTVNNKI